jgi:hypothetical protein
VRSGVIHVHLLEPVETSGYDYDHRHDLMHVVSQRISETLRDVYGVREPSRPVEGKSIERSA